MREMPMEYRTFPDELSRQVEALGDEGGVALVRSTSGTSPNIVEALKAAKEKGLLTIAQELDNKLGMVYPSPNMIFLISAAAAVPLLKR
jgi:hypothetical protein